MKTINLIALKNLDNRLLSGIFCLGPGEDEGDFVNYRLCENEDYDDGAVYVDVPRELPEDYKKKVSGALERVLTGTPYENREIIFINTTFNYA